MFATHNTRFVRFVRFGAWGRGAGVSFGFGLRDL